MSAVRTLTALGAAFGQSIPELARSASRPRDDAFADGEHPDRACARGAARSSVFVADVGQAGRFVGLGSNARPVALGRAAVVDLTGAATHTIALAAGAYETDQRRLLAFLDVLANEIERGALGSEGEETPDSTPAPRGRPHCSRCWPSATTERAATRRRRPNGHAAWRPLWTCNAEDTEFISLCALLHDIGKISTPDHVLLKPSPLELDEWDIMRDHAAAGARILSQIPSLQRCAIIVRAHHERFDGAGYPDGIFGSSHSVRSAGRGRRRCVPRDDQRAAVSSADRAAPGATGSARRPRIAVGSGCRRRDARHVLATRDRSSSHAHTHLSSA